jgi:hypothetical protein
MCMDKKCKRCEEFKEISQFPKNSRKCKICTNLCAVEYRKKMSLKGSEFRVKNCEYAKQSYKKMAQDAHKLAEFNKKRREKRLEKDKDPEYRSKRLQQQKDYWERKKRDPDFLKKKNKKTMEKYHLDPEYKEKILKKTRARNFHKYHSDLEYRVNFLNKNERYQKERKKIDPLFKLKAILRSRISKDLKNKGYSKKSKTYKLLGADFDTVYQHLVQTAISNYGFYDKNVSYHVDHIVPCCTAKNEKELINLQHYKNLQFLSKQDNLKKSKNIDYTPVYPPL